jgi:hypothetical protein
MRKTLNTVTRFTTLVAVFGLSFSFGQSWTEHTIDGEVDGAVSCYPIDIDGDGDMDVLGAGYNADDITWWENDGCRVLLNTPLMDLMTVPMASMLRI